MTCWVVLAPGPSASAELAGKVRNIPLVAIGNAFELAPWAQIIAASDAAWWRSFPAARALPAAKFCMGEARDIERVRIDALGAVVNSGVLGLECAVRAGATRILLLGADMHGTHFFGEYQNGLRNTKPHQREQHLKQYAAWARLNRNIEVMNCTHGSVLDCFRKADLDACLVELAAQRLAAA